MPAKYLVRDYESDCHFELDGEEFDLRDLTVHEEHAECARTRPSLRSRPSRSDARLRAAPLRPDRYLAMDSARMTYKLNICGTVPTEGSDCQRSNGMICQYTPGLSNSLDGVIARWSAKPAPEWSFIDDNRRDAGVKLTLKNGDDCTFRGIRKTREAIVFFPCNKAAGRLGSISVQETSTCTYVFNIPTELSCPGAVGLSNGWIFVLFFIFGSLIYVVFGCLWNRVRSGAKGFDAFPNLGFWRELPALVRDGFTFTVAKLRTLSSGPKDDI